MSKLARPRTEDALGHLLGTFTLIYKIGAILHVRPFGTVGARVLHDVVILGNEHLPPTLHVHFGHYCQHAVDEGFHLALLADEAAEAKQMAANLVFM